MKHKKVAIIGAGISGLTAAHVLEQQHFTPIIFEASPTAGGRVQTDRYQGFALDRGFQVLLSSYPAAQRNLDFDALEVQALQPGAVIFTTTGKTTIGDPLRDLTLLLPTLLSGVGSIRDKWKVLRLNRELKSKSLEAIFESPETTTLTYLKQYGFSEKMISHFFTPFFSGIFLENKLETSSRMFEFVYKMFGEGQTVIPKGGIGAIAKQLEDKLQQTTIRYNSPVEQLSDSQVILENGESHSFDYIIVATEASALISNLSKQTVSWKSCDTLYFTSDSRVIQKPIIGLIADKDALVNNIFYHSSIDQSTAMSKELLSVTIVKSHQLDQDQLIQEVQKELQRYCGMVGLTFLKRYSIKQALPDLKNLQYQMQPSETRLTETIFLAGDHQLNGSLNAAMIAGEMAAKGVIERAGGLST